MHSRFQDSRVIWSTCLAGSFQLNSLRIFHIAEKVKVSMEDNTSQAVKLNPSTIVHQPLFFSYVTITSECDSFTYR